MAENTLTQAQERTLPARRAFAARFRTPEEQSVYFRDLAERSHAGRVTLSGEEAEAVAAAYRLLASVASKLPASEATTNQAATT